MSGVEACLHRFFDDVLNRRDRTAAGELLAQSFTDHDPVLAGDADAAGLLAALDALHEALPDCRYEPLLVIPDGAQVAARWRMTGTHTGTLLGRAPTGTAVAVAGVDVLSVRDGRVEERWSKWERHVMFEQLGIGPPAPPGGD